MPRTRRKIEKSQISGWLLESEVKEMLGLGVTALWKLRTEGKLSWAKLGGRVYIKSDSIIHLLEKNSISSII